MPPCSFCVPPSHNWFLEGTDRKSKDRRGNAGLDIADHLDIKAFHKTASHARASITSRAKLGCIVLALCIGIRGPHNGGVMRGGSLDTD